MVTDPWFLGGVALALVGAAVAAVPVPEVLARRMMVAGALLFVVAAGMMIWIARSEHHFRVTEVQLVPKSRPPGGFSGSASVLARFATRGGKGEVVFRLYGEGGYASTRHRVPIASDSTFEYVGSVPLVGTRPQNVAIEVQEPNIQAASVVVSGCPDT